jgi:hypothetical protein
MIATRTWFFDASAIAWWNSRSIGTSVVHGVESSCRASYVRPTATAARSGHALY